MLVGRLALPPNALVAVGSKAKRVKRAVLRWMPLGKHLGIQRTKGIFPEHFATRAIWAAVAVNYPVSESGLPLVLHILAAKPPHPQIGLRWQVIKFDAAITRRMPLIFQSDFRGRARLKRLAHNHSMAANS